MRRLKRKKSNLGVSTVIAEMLMLVLTVILAVAFVASLDSNISYYIQNKPLSSVNVWTITKNNWVNFTATNSGGDPTEIIGHIYLENQNGSSTNLSAQLTYNNTYSNITGSFNLPTLKFGQQFQISINTANLGQGTIQYIISSQSQILAQEDIPI